MSTLYYGLAMRMQTSPSTTRSCFSATSAPLSGPRINLPSLHRPRYTYVPPEAVFEPITPLSFESDIWSLGCILFELFADCSLISGFMTTQDEITVQQVTLRGPMPEDWWLRRENRSEWFDTAGKILDDSRSLGSLEKRVEGWIQDARKDYGYTTMSDEEKTELIEMLKCILIWKPAERPNAEQVLDMPWVKNWALPAYEAEKKGS